MLSSTPSYLCIAVKQEHTDWFSPVPNSLCHVTMIRLLDLLIKWSTCQDKMFFSFPHFIWVADLLSLAVYLSLIKIRSIKLNEGKKKNILSRVSDHILPLNCSEGNTRWLFGFVFTYSLLFLICTDNQPYTLYLVLWKYGNRDVDFLSCWFQILCVFVFSSNLLVLGGIQISKIY